MRKALERLPPDIGAAYDSALSRIRSRGPEAEEVVLKGLAWILYAARALHVNELQDAISIETWSTARDPENLVDVETLFECFSGLVVVESGTVRFVHYTLQEYLSDPSRSHLLPSK